jgi:cysteine desulfurase
MIVVNALGKLCPQPIIELALEIKKFPNESAFKLLSDDPATWLDLQAWARMTKTEVTKIERDTFHIQR